MNVKTLGENIIEYIQDNISFVRATGSAAMSLTLGTPVSGKTWKLKDLRITLSAAGSSGSLTVTIDSSVTAAYDHLILTQDMTSVTDLRFDTETIIDADDEVDIVWANTAAITYAIEALTEAIY